MNRPDQTNGQSTTSRRPCLVDGCTCKDARIVSRRRAAYFAARARQTGQTANRVVRGEPGWYSAWLDRASSSRSTAPVMDGWPAWRLADLSLSIAADA